LRGVLTGSIQQGRGRTEGRQEKRTKNTRYRRKKNCRVGKGGKKTPEKEKKAETNSFWGGGMGSGGERPEVGGGRYDGGGTLHQKGS